MLHGLLRIAQHLQRLGRAVACQVQRLHGEAGEGLDQGIRNPVLGGGGFLARSSLACGGLRAAIHQRHGHRNEGNAVGNAVVDAHDERAALGAVVTHKVFDEVYLPQGAAWIERLHGQFPHAVLQRALHAVAFAAGQLLAQHMRSDVEVAVLHPGGARRVFHHPLTKARILQQALLHAFAQHLPGDAGRQGPHAVDHHQVAAGVHAQPGRIDFAHALARQAQHAGGRAAHVFLDHGSGLAGGGGQGLGGLARHLRPLVAQDAQGARAVAGCGFAGGRNAGHHRMYTYCLIFGGLPLWIERPRAVLSP